MGTFQITGPDGKKYRIVGDTPEGAYNALLKSLGQQPQAAPAPSQAEAASPGMFGDVMSSLGAGLRRGVEGIVGLPGDIRDINIAVARGGRDLLGGALGVSPETLSMTDPAFDAAKYFMGPNTDTIRQGTGALLGAAYEPQTTAGEYARTIGEFAPAMAAGPGGIARKAAMTVVPALASETAGQLTEGTAAEPYARLGGALAGGVVAAGVKGPTAIMRETAAKSAPSREELAQFTNRLYGLMRDAGVKYDANDYARTIQNAADDLMKEGFRPVGVDKPAFEWIEFLSQQIGKSLDFDDVNGLVRSIGEQARGAAARPDGKSLSKALNMIRDKLMDFESTAAFTSQVGMPRELLNKVRGTARNLARRRIQERSLQDILDKSENYAAGQESGIRNGINQLLRSKRGQQLFNNEERAMLTEVANGRKPLQSLSRFGFDLQNISGNAVFMPVAGFGALAAGTGSTMAGAGLTAAGTIAKMLSPYLTDKAFQQAMAAIRSGKMADKTLMNAARAERVRQNIRRAISAQPTLSGLPVAQ